MISKSELKFIRSLKIKKYRTAEKHFLVEGEKNVLELLSSDYNVYRLFVTSEFQEAFSSKLAKVPHTLVSEKELQGVSALTSNDKALAVVQMKDHSIDALDISKMIVALDGVNDPGNLGTIIRTMDWFGLNQLICSEDTVDFYNPKVIQATMGSFTRMRIAHANLSSFLSAYKGRRIGADISGQPLSKSVIKAPAVIVMGSESHGIRPDVKTHIDEFVTIPKFGSAESLNVGIATGIICHQLVTANV
jgi:TrmH family RNA methyltransferase